VLTSKLNNKITLLKFGAGKSAVRSANNCISASFIQTRLPQNFLKITIMRSVFVPHLIYYLISGESLCLLKILAKDHVKKLFWFLTFLESWYALWPGCVGLFLLLTVLLFHVWGCGKYGVSNKTGQIWPVFCFLSSLSCAQSSPR
jgi:hypothetical protein